MITVAQFSDLMYTYEMKMICMNSFGYNLRIFVYLLQKCFQHLYLLQQNFGTSFNSRTASMKNLNKIQEFLFDE